MVTVPDADVQLIQVNTPNVAQMMVTVPPGLKAGDSFAVQTAIAPVKAIPVRDIAAAVRVKGPVRFQDAAAYNSTLSKEQSDAASRGCHYMYMHGCKTPVGVSYHVVCCDCCLWTPFFSWINPCIHVGLFMGLCRDKNGGWHNNKGPLLSSEVSGNEMRIKVVDTDHGTMACYGCRQADRNEVPCCWCDK